MIAEAVDTNEGSGSKRFGARAMSTGCARTQVTKEVQVHALLVGQVQRCTVAGFESLGLVRSWRYIGFLMMLHRLLPVCLVVWNTRRKKHDLRARSDRGNSAKCTDVCVCISSFENMPCSISNRKSRGAMAFGGRGVLMIEFPAGWCRETPA